MKKTKINLVPDIVNPTPDYYCTWQTQLYATSDGKPEAQRACITEKSLFILEREYVCPLNQNAIYMTDIIKNIGSAQAPLEVLYHCNMGYPLLSENAEVTIPAKSVKARNEHANKDIADCLKMEKPQNGYEEKCYYFETEGNVTATIYNKDINKGVSITYNADELQFFTEWKMMGEYEYVLGLEPGNCTPDGRDVMRKSGKLEFLNAGDTKVHHLKFEFFNK